MIYEGLFDRDELCKSYFRLGLNNKEILQVLADQHNIIISTRTLKRSLKRCGIFRRKYLTDVADVAIFLLRECESSGICHGYRWMYEKCKQSGLLVSQRIVHLLLGIIEPQGVRERLNRRLRRRLYTCPGPDALWHIDGNDKLKPYGIAIHGCIDGFSRQIIWMQVHKTNKNPKLIASYYLDAVERRGGFPERIRADRGTENTCVRQMQIFLRSSHVDRYAGAHSFMYGKSTANQRIENWWSLLRKECLDFWMDLFKQLQEDGLFEGDLLDTNLIRFCFLERIQTDINSVVDIWNSHRIRRSNNTLLPPGRPLMMYIVPEMFGAARRLKRFDNDRFHLCQQEVPTNVGPMCDEDVFQLCALVTNEMQWTLSSDPYELCDLYLNLREEIRNAL